MSDDRLNKDHQNTIFRQIYRRIGCNPQLPGHVEGERKAQFLKDAKLLINTSIHEALPVSFLEAMSYGCALVSNRNPDNLTSMFGIWTGDVLGDGLDKIDLYVNAVRDLMSKESKRKK